MNRYLLSLITLLGMSLAAPAKMVAAADPVQSAVYAEVRGIPGGRMRIYKGACSFHNAALNLFSKAWNPTLCFFDAKGHMIAQEKCKDWHLLDKSAAGFTWSNYKKAIHNIRSRLTHKPKAHHAQVVGCIKGPGRQSIELCDKQGTIIACTDFACWGCLKEGDSLAQEAIDALSDSICNPDILLSLKITRTRANWPLYSVNR